jgi:hypothetical protein
VFLGNVGIHLQDYEYTVLQSRRPHSQHSPHGKPEQLPLINIIRESNSSDKAHYEAQ